jgi:hypothetical protein
LQFAKIPAARAARPPDEIDNDGAILVTELRVPVSRERNDISSPDHAVRACRTEDRGYVFRRP